MDCVAGMMRACVVGDFQSLWIARGEAKRWDMCRGGARQSWDGVLYVFMLFYGVDSRVGMNSRVLAGDGGNSGLEVCSSRWENAGICRTLKID